MGLDTIKINRCLDFSHAFFFWDRGKTCFDPTASDIKALLHAVNSFKQARINQRGDWLAIFIDNQSVMPILNLIEHFAQILSKVNRTSFRNHRSSQSHIDHMNHIGHYGQRPLEGKLKFLIRSQITPLPHRQIAQLHAADPYPFEP